jgi:predicted peptidase
MFGCVERARSADGEVSGLKAARIARPFGAMVYRYFAPPAAKPVAPLPLVVYLHSNGRQGMDNKKQVDFRVSRWVDAQASHPCYVLAPQLPDGFWVDVDFSKGRYDAATTPATTANLLPAAIFTEKDFNIGLSGV